MADELRDLNLNGLSLGPIGRAPRHEPSPFTPEEQEMMQGFTERYIQEGGRRDLIAIYRALINSEEIRQMARNRGWPVNNLEEVFETLINREEAARRGNN